MALWILRLQHAYVFACLRVYVYIHPLKLGVLNSLKWDTYIDNNHSLALQLLKCSISIDKDIWPPRS